jgi:AP-1 complex subunit mu
MGCSAIYFLD